MPTEAPVGTSRPTGRQTWVTAAIVVLFSLVLLSAPVGLVARSVFGEPYPWLFQPSFGYVLAADGVLEVDTPRLIAVTAQGEEMEVTIADVMPPVRTNAVLMFRNTLQREEVIKSSETASLFASQLARSFPDKEFAELRVEWIDERIDVRTGVRTPGSEGREFVIVLGAASEGGKVQ